MKLRKPKLCIQSPFLDQQNSLIGIIFIFSLISNFRHVLNAVCFLLGNSSGVWILYADVSEHCFIFIGRVRWNRRIVPKRQYIKLRRRGITQKRIQNLYLISGLQKFWHHPVHCRMLHSVKILTMPILVFSQYVVYWYIGLMKWYSDGSQI